MTEENQIKLITRLAGRTCIGVNTKGFPVSYGNCFSVKTENGESFRILNFAAENMDELLKRGLEFPVKVKVLHGHFALIHDERISEKWYASRICEVCCPEELLPYPQKWAHERAEANGSRKNFGNGWLMRGPVIIPQL